MNTILETMSVDVLRLEKTVMPCRMTVDELRAEVLQSVKDAQNGLGISIEQVRSKHPRYESNTAS